jgi:hypothetical protein
LQRWLRQAGLASPPALLVSHPALGRASEPHQVWQMDACEGLKLKTGTKFCWLRLADECSGAILLTEVFEPARWADVPEAQTRQAIRNGFGLYGCPQGFRVDNGRPWAIPGGLPSELSLWLAGLGVRMHWNEPYRPEQNGVVESTQRVSQRWVWPASCADLQEVRVRLAREDGVQREQYPAVDGLSRRQAYPALLHSGRGYSRRWEWDVWDPSQAAELLGCYRLLRKVSVRGQVSMYHRLIEVGRARGGTWVYVGLDARTAEWLITDVAGQEVRRRPARQFSPDSIRQLLLW